MGERTDQIERHIAETCSELGDNLGELQDKVKSAVDWRTQFQQHPGTFLAVAFGGGVVLSALLPSSKPQAKDSPSRDTSRPNDLSRNINAFTGALLGVAVQHASGFLDTVLPGFHQEFTKAKDKDSSQHNLETSDATTEESSPTPLAAGASA